MPLSELVHSLLQKDVTTWHFELSKQLDVYTSVTFKTNDMIMKEKQAGGVLKVTSESELCRSYQIFFRGTPWLEVKKSLLSNAGYGLFVARPEGFKCHEVVGINYGKIIKGPQPCNTSEYAFAWRGVHGDQPATYIDAQCGVKSGRGKGSKAYFAIHMANDPSYQKRKARRKDLPAHNMYTTEELEARTSRDVKFGEELYLAYRYEDSDLCTCSGCKEVQSRYTY